MSASMIVLSRCATMIVVRPLRFEDSASCVAASTIYIYLKKFTISFLCMTFTCEASLHPHHRHSVFFRILCMSVYSFSTFTMTFPHSRWPRPREKSPLHHAHLKMSAMALIARAHRISSHQETSGIDWAAEIACLYSLFGQAVKGAGGFIQQQYARVLQNRTCKCHSLLLTCTAPHPTSLS